MAYAPTIASATRELKILTKKRIALGKIGESLAVTYLQEQGIDVKIQNYRQKTGEIDIIAYDGNCLVFVEVKTRQNLAFGLPFEAVTRKKQAQITRVALDYISRNNVTQQAIRFDVISILMAPGSKPQIEHLKNCFEAVSC